jgi:transcriptional regulator with XRE-family HTH domain
MSIRGAAGTVLRDARIACGLTLRDLPSMSDGAFKSTTVAAYERGERQISLERFCQLSALYGVPPERLLAAALRGWRAASRELFGVGRGEAPQVTSIR